MVDAVFGTVAGWITTKIFVACWCGAVALAALGVYYLGFRRKARPVREGLRSGLAVVRETADPQQFLEHYEELNQRLRDNTQLRECWDEYTHCMFPSVHRANGIMQASCPPQSVFSLSGLLEGRLNLRLYEEMPNYLTGTGILGTFIGLTAGIYLAQGGLVAAEVETMKFALSGLLGGASLAFLTSVVGLGTSLVFSWKEKRWIHRISQELDEWCYVLEARLEVTSVEKLASEQLAENRKQTEQLQRFNTDLAVSISTALDEKLHDRFAPAFEKVVKVLEEVRDERSASNERVMQELVDKFQQTMSGAAGEEMSAMSGTLRQLSEGIQLTAEKLSGASDEAGSGLVESSRAAAEEMRRVMAEMSAKLEEGRKATDEAILHAIERMSQQVETLSSTMQSAADGAGKSLQGAASGAGASIQDAATKVGESLLTGAGELEEQLRGFGESVNRFSGSLTRAEALAQGTEHAFAQLNESIGSLKTANSSIREASLPLSETARAIISQLQGQRETLSGLREAAGKMHASAETMQTAAKKQEQAWLQTLARFEGIDVSLVGAFKEINEGVEAYSEKIREFVTSLDKSLAKATQLLSGAISDLGQTVEEFGERSK